MATTIAQRAPTATGVIPVPGGRFLTGLRFAAPAVARMRGDGRGDWREVRGTFLLGGFSTSILRGRWAAQHTRESLV